VNLRDVGFYLRGRLNRGLSRVLNRRRRAGAPVPLEQVLAGDGSPLALARLLTGRSNAAREAAVAWYLERRGVPFRRCPFRSFEGAGQNFVVDVGEGDRVLLLIAHHDAVPGSPGANDNAGAVAVLLALLDRLARREPRGVRVRLLFSAAEELGYLGARAYVRQERLDEVVGVLSLELCGIGDALAVWDTPDAPPRFLQAVAASLEALGLRRDEGYHLVGRIPVFGSDHRAFAAAGLPAYGLTVVPLREAEALRRFVFSPVRSVFRAVVRRPPPFDTYHTPRDDVDTLEAAALDRVGRALEAIVAAVGR
jgi:Zn-dependent M28 family amino/carboxypeptidase